MQDTFFIGIHIQSLTAILKTIYFEDSLRYYGRYTVVCISPFISRPGNATLWSDSKSWEKVEPGWGGHHGNGEFAPPVDGDDVMIPAGTSYVINLSKSFRPEYVSLIVPIGYSYKNGIKDE